MNKNDKIYVAGHKGLVGSAILRKLQAEGYSHLLLRSHQELDLIHQQEVEAFFKTEKPEYVFLAAAKVGGILANRDYPAEFIYENLLIQSNAIHASYLTNVKKLVFLGSSCIYPRNCPQPLKEDYLLTGILEETNEPYALAKIAGIKMCQAYNKQYGTRFISLMPTNLYGPGDNFDLETSHVLPALVRKFHEAKIKHKTQNQKEEPERVTIWGTGNPRREFLHVDDFADACIFLMNQYEDNQIINVGTGEDLSIKELAELIGDVVGFNGEIRNDPSKPDGTPQKLLDIGKLKALGWQSKISLREGITQTYDWYVKNLQS